MIHLIDFIRTSSEGGNDMRAADATCSESAKRSHGAVGILQDYTHWLESGNVTRDKCSRF